MSSAVVSTSAALGRPFLFEEQAVTEVSLPAEWAQGQGRPPQRVHPAELAFADPRLAHITSASRLEIRPAPSMVSSGIAAIDALTGGLPRGCVTEICGSASSGRTTLLLSALAAATRREEFCVVVDASDALDPYSAVAAGVELDRLLWVRCGENSLQKKNSQKQRALEKKASPEDRTTRRTNPAEDCLEQVLRATDLLLESGGFGMIVLDLGDLPLQAARRIPLTTWFRFRRAIEHTPTILLAVEQYPIAGSCSSLLLQMGVLSSQFPVLSSPNSVVAENRISSINQVDDLQLTAGSHPTHAQLLTGFNINAELTSSRLERKPASSTRFETKTAWAG